MLYELQTISDRLPLPLPVPVLPEIVLPEIPAEAAIPGAPALTQAYATLTQDYIDGRISDWSQYYTPVSALLAEIRASGEAIRRKYHDARRQLLQLEGRKNGTLLPGNAQRRLLSLSTEERRDLSETALKVVSERINASLENVSWAVEAGFQSVELRANTATALNKLDLEIVKAAVNAGIKAAMQNVERANKVIDLTRVAVEQAILAARLADEQYAVAAVEAKALTMALRVDGVQIEAGALTAELQVAAAQLRALEAEIIVLQAELQRSSAQLDVANAELLVAAAREITAQYEIDLAGARVQAARQIPEQVGIRIDKITAEEGRVDAQASIERAELALSVKEKQLTLAQDRFDVARKNLEAALTDLKTAIPESDYIITSLRIQATEQAASRELSVLQDLSNRRISAMQSDAALKIAVMRQLSSSRTASVQTLTAEKNAATQRISDIRLENIDQRTGERTTAIQAESDTRSATLSRLTNDRLSVTKQLSAAKIKTTIGIARARHFLANMLWLQQEMSAQKEYQAKTDSQRESIGQATDIKKEAIITAAQKAADARMESTHEYVKG